MPAILRKNKKDLTNKSCPNSPAVDCAENIKLELTAAEDSSAAETPLVQIKSLIEKKIRNLEKRKMKLEQTKMDLQAGKELVEDQLKALKQLDCVESQIELAKEFLKNVKQIMTESEHIHQLKPIRTKEHEADVAKIRQLLIMQEVLECLGKDSVRQDFRTGSKGALKLSEKQFDLLDEAYLKLCPSREDLADKSAWLALLDEAAKYSSSLLNKINQPAPGRDTTFAEIRSLIDDILECDYFVLDGVQTEETVANGSTSVTQQTDIGSISTGISISNNSSIKLSSASASASASTTTTDLQTSPVIEENDSSSSQLAALAQNVVGTSSNSHRASSSSLSSASAATNSAADGPVSPPVAAVPVHFVHQPASITAFCAPEFLHPPPDCSAPPPFVDHVGFYTAPPAPVTAPAATLYESHDGSLYPIQPTYTPAEYLNPPISVCPPGQESMAFIYNPNPPSFVAVSNTSLYDDGNIYYNDYAPVEQAYYVTERDHVPSTHVFNNGIATAALPVGQNLHHSSSKSLDPNAPAFVSRVNTSVLAQQESPSNTSESTQINQSNITGDQDLNYRKEMDMEKRFCAMTLEATKKSENQIPPEFIEEEATNETVMCSAAEESVIWTTTDLKNNLQNTNSLILPQSLSKAYAFVVSHNGCDSSAIVST